MPIEFKGPTLAVDIVKIHEEGDELVLPRYGSLKYDGFRIITPNGIPVTRSLKPLANLHSRGLLSDPLMANLDMEIMATEPNAVDAFNTASSAFRKVKGEPELRAFVFDDLTRMDLPFDDRMNILASRKLPSFVTVVEQRPIESQEQLDQLYKWSTDNNYEGVMLRDKTAHYEQRRTTTKNQFLVKIKPFDDETLTLDDVEEGTVNMNEAFIAENGRTKRSTHQENMVPSGMAGTLVGIRADGSKLNVGPGRLTHAERAELLANKEKFIGRKFVQRSMAYGVFTVTGVSRQGRFLKWGDDAWDR